jgi:hypothetical protein
MMSYVSKTTAQLAINLATWTEAFSCGAVAVKPPTPFDRSRSAGALSSKDASRQEAPLRIRPFGGVFF